MQLSPELINVQNAACQLAKDYRHEYLMPEHLLYALCDETTFAQALAHTNQSQATQLQDALKQYLTQQEQTDEQTDDESIETSFQMSQLITTAFNIAESSGCNTITIPHIVYALTLLGDKSWACSLLQDYAGDTTQLVATLSLDYGSGRTQTTDNTTTPTIHDNYDPDNYDNYDNTAEQTHTPPHPTQATTWTSLVTCISDELRDNPQSHNPLIGREAELERTIQVLCRRDKNNPLHVGEPGVGKTALVYGLAQRINERRVPQRLLDTRIYLLDIGTLLAGTQYRGDFERRIKLIIDGISQHPGDILYIDEIHNIVGAGRTEGSLDASNLLKPYFEAGNIRFIGSTTFTEYNRHFASAPGMIRRFQQIDILEPTIDDTIKIIQGLRSRYEDFHKVTYDKGVVEHAVKMSARYLNERFLPDKAIDLIDEAGAWLETNHDTTKQTPEAAGIVTKRLIDEVLARMCKVESLADNDDDNDTLLNLEPNIARRIFGQDAAVKKIVEAVQTSRAGLLDDNKPIASFLFVGPTGVGKTEVARVLAQELSLELIRFDMSEYAEKHAVAKLIGSPAGYVGYEDGGLLTDAVRKTPHCVLLFDEIEKAHADIFNIFLQMMDYARLSDNKGRHTDFRHAIIIMTSNAGAQYASQAAVGFDSHVTTGEAMLSTVRKTFKPEFLARLSATIVFADMDQTMAQRILDKKLQEFYERLATRHVDADITPAAHDALLKEGFSPKTGAREMDRVIAQHLKPLFTRAILFGNLKNGGKATIDLTDDTFTLNIQPTCQPLSPT